MEKKDYYVPVEKTFFDAVMAELAYAEDKHRSWPEEDAVHASAILNEEAGKLTRASIDFTYGHPGEHPDMRKYALRVAAMALRFYGSIPTYRPRNK
jgi:hypothetical protein